MVPGTPSSAPTPGRLLFVDNLRWLMIVLVVTMHAAVTYSGLGSWYYTEPKPLSTLSLVVFAFYQSHLQAFFMGLLFLIAGYFVPHSFDRKGARRLMADRAVRLGLPTLLYALLIHPAVVYYLLNLQRGAPVPSVFYVFRHYVLSFGFLSGTGPLWFTLALLIFTGIYVLTRREAVFPVQNHSEARLPRHAAVVLLIGTIAVCTFAVRVVQPVGTAVLNMQLCFFSQYILLFVVGIVASRENWLLRLPRDFGVFWLRLVLITGPLLWLAPLAVRIILGGGARAPDFSRFQGGWHWESAASCFWESFFCVGVCLGLIVVFREHFNRQGKVARFLSENAFSVYVFHTPILITVSLAMRRLAWAPLSKFLLLSGTSLVVCFVASHYVIRRIPGWRRIL